MLRRLADAGLDMLRVGHLTVLRALDPGRGMRASALARDAGVTRQAIAQTVSELEKLGLVEQIPDPTDARAKIVRYTESGKRGYRRAMRVFTDLEREQHARLGDARISALKHDLRCVALSGLACPEGVRLRGEVD